MTDAHVGPHVSVRDNPARSRYEVYLDGTLAGFAQYKLASGLISFSHTETDPEFARQGLAKRLVTAALEDARERGLGVLPFCPYVSRFISRHPAFIDLVPPAQRARFGLSQ